MKTKDYCHDMLIAAVAMVLDLGMESCVDNRDNITKTSDNQQQVYALVCTVQIYEEISEPPKKMW